MIECEVCGEACHGLPDGSPRCLKHLPEPAGSIAQVPSQGGGATLAVPAGASWGDPEERIP